MNAHEAGNNITAKIKAHFEKYSAFPTEIFDNEYDRKFVDSCRKACIIAGHLPKI